MGVVGVVVVISARGVGVGGGGVCIHGGEGGMVEAAALVGWGRGWGIDGIHGRGGGEGSWGEAVGGVCGGYEI